MTQVQTDAPRRQSPHARLQAALRQLLAEAGESVEIPILADRLLEMVDADPAWRQGLLRPSIETFAREAVQRHVASTRGLLVFGTEVVTRREFERRVHQRAQRFERWREHVGDRHLKLMDMTRAELQRAAAERITRGLEELRIAALELRLADRLEDDQTVRNAWSTEEIALLVDRLGIEWHVVEQDGPEITN
ncbi:MAG TPA: hypothetical protein VFB50_10495 [Chloroflexota bacterium]|nr:hypothetical protein [Chloroflexota bacterium]